ncbi:MFS transporter [Candidatus Poribacteria bacterium]|nr:MFS transporter [Candidatus Poribacteria bacterium]
MENTGTAPQNNATVKAMFIVGSAWFGMSAFFAFNMASIPLFFSARIEQKWIVGVIWGMMGGFGIIAAPVLGMVSDRIRHRLGRRRPLMILGLPFMLVILVTTQYLPTTWLMALIWPLVYLFHLIIERPWGALLPDIFPPDKRATANGVCQLLGGAGNLLYYTLGGLLWARSEEMTFYLVAAVYAVGVLTAIFGVKEKPTHLEVKANTTKGEKGSLLDYFKGLLEHKDLLKYTLACLLWNLGLNGVLPWLTSFGTKEMGMSVVMSQLMLALCVVVVVIFAIPFGMLADRIGHKVVTNIGLVLFVIVNILVYFTYSVPLLFVLMGLVAFGFCIVMVVPFALMLNLIPEDRMAELMGLSSTSVYASVLVGPFFTGMLIDAVGSYRPIFLFAAFSHAMGLLFLQGVKERKHREVPGASGVSHT